jgi:hypothetical protein
MQPEEEPFAISHTDAGIGGHHRPYCYEETPYLLDVCLGEVLP